ncbi:short chain dehydrogenase [Cesiribacter sp. SM1]|uniref:short chain dehydrogenase n=1 Tax=Cesiribacter sp. SM1 TaxID=2861196 RepID=UPI001CD6C4B5|nr:short chain dehydrogenase [Cesiribacter sp. SM1]
MKIILVGASGTIGKQIHEALSPRHEIITASLNKGQVKVDITKPQSIQAMFTTVGSFDALISATGSGPFGAISALTDEDFNDGIRSKLMGQINLVLTGQKYIRDGGSFTLTSGILSEEPIAGGTVLSVVNGGLNSFAMAASAELQRGLRLNVVSPGIVEDSADAIGQYFPGHNPVSMQRVVNAYIKSLEGIENGRVIQVY